ncbi:MAG: AAA family ATPase [Gaiellaceae bacterium]
MTRVAVIGPGGAGKSRIARQLGEAVGARVVELDRLFWRPGWVETPAPEWEAIQRHELGQEPWIVDGLHKDTMSLWLEAADTIVFLDVSPLVATWRVSRRRLSGQARSTVPDGCEPAPAHRALVKFLLYQWEYRRTIRPEILRILERRRGNAEIAILRTREEVDTFVGRQCDGEAQPA